MGLRYAWENRERSQSRYRAKLGKLHGKCLLPLHAVDSVRTHPPNLGTIQRTNRTGVRPFRAPVHDQSVQLGMRPKQHPPC